MEEESKSKLAEKITTVLLYFSILFFFIGFNFQDNSVGFWYKQYLPDLGTAPIQDMKFIDSLLGYAITYEPNARMLKTTNGGDNWNIIYTHNHSFLRLQFMNKDSGYVLSINQLFKTTNGGDNWTIITLPGDLYPGDIFALNFDTLWAADGESLTGGLFRSTNGGYNWIQQYYIYGQNPMGIYMYNKDIGFIYTSNSKLKKTTNGGVDWILTDFSITSGYITDLKLLDSLTGWLARGIDIKNTSNGGLNWTTINVVPQTDQIYPSGISKFSFINKDTIWGFGQTQFHYPNGQIRGLLQKTTNGGNNWGFQMPDTSLNISYVNWGQFINKKIGWAYKNDYIYAGLHTTTGGIDTLIFVGVKENNSVVPKDYVLYQNYPNPFNPTTNIKYRVPFGSITNNRFVILKVYNILGKEITTLVNEKIKSGEYEVKFNGSGLPSGVYFYSLYVDGVRTDTKKMILVK